MGCVQIGVHIILGPSADVRPPRQRPLGSVSTSSTIGKICARRPAPTLAPNSVRSEVLRRCPSTGFCLGLIPRLWSACSALRQSRHSGVCRRSRWLCGRLYGQLWCSAGRRGHPRSPAAVEDSIAVVDGVRDYVEAADPARRANGSLEGERQNRTVMTLAMTVLVDRKLTKQCDRHGIRLFAPMKFGQECSIAFNHTAGAMITWHINFTARQPYVFPETIVTMLSPDTLQSLLES